MRKAAASAMLVGFRSVSQFEGLKVKKLADEISRPPKKSDEKEQKF